jgi:hypothetical protein
MDETDEKGTLQRSKQRFFLLVGNFAEFSFSGGIVTA